MVVLSANDIPGEGTLSFLAREIPRAHKSWGPDFRVTGLLLQGWPKKKSFPGIVRLTDFPSQHSRTESMSGPEWDSARFVLTTVPSTSA